VICLFQLGIAEFLEGFLRLVFKPQRGAKYDGFQPAALRRGPDNCTRHERKLRLAPSNTINVINLQYTANNGRYAVSGVASLGSEQAEKIYPNAESISRIESWAP